MLSKAKLKELASYRQTKRQEEDGVFVVEGPKMAAEAMASAAEVVCVCAPADWIEQSGLWGTGSAEYNEVSQAELERLSLMQCPNQVWMLVRRMEGELSNIESGKLVLALDRLQDPGNMGTIMRTADWYGVRHIVCSHDTVSCYNPKVVQASMGAVFRTRVDYVDLPQWLAACGRPVYGASLGGTPLTERPADDSVLLIGNESRGISPEAMAHVTRPVLIPNLGGTAESLNAAVAAAILIDKLIG